MSREQERRARQEAAYLKWYGQGLGILGRRLRKKPENKKRRLQKLQKLARRRNRG